MNELEVKRVPFMGTDLMAAKDESGTIWAGVRWMCDGMGLSKGQRDRQITNINADSVISKGAANLRLPTAGGKQSVLCLKLDFVPLWLAKINITPAMQAETPELAERYNLSPASVRRRIQAGEFGEVVRAGGRTKLVTLEGLRAYEAAHTGPAYTPPGTTSAARRKKSRENPGRI